MKLNLLFLEITMKSNAVCYQLKFSLTSLAFEWKQIESDSGKRYSCRRQFHYLTSFSDHNKLLIEGYEKKYGALWWPHIEKKSCCDKWDPILCWNGKCVAKALFTALNGFNCSRDFWIFRHVPEILCPVRSLTPGLYNKGTINIGISMPTSGPNCQWNGKHYNGAKP